MRPITCPVARKKRSAFRGVLWTPSPARNATNGSPRGALRFIRAAAAMLACLAGMIVSSALLAAGQSSANFAIPRDAINAGVGPMSSTNFILQSSVGDAVGGGVITSAGYQLASGFRFANPPAAVMNLLRVFARKMHGAMPFEVEIDKSQPITGTISVEPRAIGAGHTIVFRFDNPITAEGAAIALDATMAQATTVTLSRSGNDVIAVLANVADNKRLTIRLTGVNGGTNVEASLGFLVGDVNSTKRVTAADIAAVKANLSQPVNSHARAKFDLNADGSITAADISAAKARAGVAIP
jgi:Dockerin type I domain